MSNMMKPSECKCKICVNACRNPAHLLPDGDWYIARFLKISREKLKDLLVETPVAVVRVDGQKMVMMRGLRPKTANGWCVFFKNGLCSIHPVKPFGCKYAYCKTTKKEAEGLLKYLTDKWYIHNWVNNKLEIFDMKNVKQQKEIFAELSKLDKIIEVIKDEST